MVVGATEEGKRVERVKGDVGNAKFMCRTSADLSDLFNRSYEGTIHALVLRRGAYGVLGYRVGLLRDPILIL